MGRFGNLYHKAGATNLPFQFIAADTTANAGATVTPTSLVADTFQAEEMIITMKATCAAASTSTVTFNWLGRCHQNELWGTVADFSTTLTLNGTTQAVNKKILDGIPFSEIKLLSIVNGDGANALSAVNAFVTYKH